MKKLLGGTVVLDKVLTDNLTSFKLGEDATVTRNTGFTIGDLEFENYTLTLGSDTTDLTINLGDSSDNGTSSGSSDNGTGSGSPSGTLATVLADQTIKDSTIKKQLLEKLSTDVSELQELVRGLTLLKEVSARSLDYLISFGERLSDDLVKYVGWFPN